MADARVTERAAAAHASTSSATRAGGEPGPVLAGAGWTLPSRGDLHQEVHEGLGDGIRAVVVDVMATAGDHRDRAGCALVRTLWDPSVTTV